MTVFAISVHPLAGRSNGSHPDRHLFFGMIEYVKHTLPNGLRVIIHEDHSTPVVAVNMLYDVGSRDDDPRHTGFAHLFEHLMFAGSEHAPSYDDPVQFAGGESNAFTNADITNFFCVVPAANLRLALYLEADRMQYLRLDKKVLKVERQIVCEEFKETCFGEPYGYVWHLLSDLAYREHPYRWPVIGKTIEHISGASLEDVRRFYHDFYGPNNAICVVAGPVPADTVMGHVRQIFGGIDARPRPQRPFIREARQESIRRAAHTSDVPEDAVFMAFHMPGRTEPGFYEADLLTDILASGDASRLYQTLVKDMQFATSADAYITGTNDPGLLIIEAKCADGHTPEQVERAIWGILDTVRNNPIPERELARHKHKSESSIAFSNMSVLNKSMNLAYFESIGDPELINTEQEHYERITAEKLQNTTRVICKEDNCAVLYYLSNSSKN